MKAGCGGVVPSHESGHGFDPGVAVQAYVDGVVAGEVVGGAGKVDGACEAGGDDGVGGACRYVDGAGGDDDEQHWVDAS